jgi:type VI secretion system protein ImpL
MDAQLVGSVRDMLASYPLEYRIYSRLKRQFRGELPDFSVAAAGGPNAAKVFERASGEPLARGVPGFYTRDGYQKAFQGTVSGAAAQLAAEEQWVLGQRSAKNLAATALGSELGERVRRLYLQDYIKAWDAYLADVKLVRLGGIERSMDVARLLSTPDSPLAAYVRAVARETTLVPPAREPNALDKAAQAAKKAQSDLAKLADPGAAPSASGGPIEKMVDDHFAPIRRQAEGQPAPIDDTTKLFAEVYAQLQGIDAAQKSKSAPPAGGGGEKVKAAAGQQPEPIKSMLETLADAGAKQGRTAERESLTTELKPIYDFCTRAVANRYPFASGSRADVLPEDFGQLFGPGGMLDEFYQRRLATLVDTGGATWAYKPLADGSRPATPAALADFQRAARIKEAFFRAGGRTPGFRIDLKPVDIDPALKDLTLDIDGQALKFQPGTSTPATVSWPSQRVASQIKLSANGGTPLVFDGPWALFRMFDRFEVQPSAQPEKFNVVMNLEGKRARFEVVANSVFNPLRLREVQQFRCPGAL